MKISCGKVRLLASHAVAIAGAVALSAPPPVIFTDVTARSGLGSIRSVSGTESKDYILETLGTGVAAFDYDNDGWLDLYLANGSRLEGFAAGAEPLPSLFRNKGDGTFEDRTRDAGLAAPFWGFGAAVGDYDNDGFIDLYVTAYGPNRLYHNRGDGTFEEVSRAAGVDDPRWGASAAFSDFDGDGLLDLYVANYVAFDTRTVPKRGDPNSPCLYRGALVMCGPAGLKGEVDVLYHNNGDGTFSDVTAAAGIRTDIGLYGLGVATADYDADGDMDIFIANDATPNELYRNKGDGTFEEVGAVGGVAYGTDGVEQGSMGTSFGDFDDDGRLDLAVTNFSHQFYQVFHNTGDGAFEDVSFATGVAQITYLPLGWATEFLDYDNDGRLDLFFANGHVYPGADRMQIGISYLMTNQLLHNEPASGATPGAGGRAFVDVSAGAGPGFTVPRSHRAGGPFDFDRDGDLDLVLTVIDGAPLLLRNEIGSSNTWAAFRLAGTGSNRSAIGTRLTITAGGRRLTRFFGGGGSFLWGCDRLQPIGLGTANVIEALEVLWPSGRRQRFENLGVRREYLLLEGSAPKSVEPPAAGAAP